MENDFILSEDQRRAVDQLIDWFGQDCPNQYITLGGYAGTGKTSTIGQFKKEIDNFLKIEAENERSSPCLTDELIHDDDDEYNIIKAEINKPERLSIVYLAPTGKAALQLQRRIKGNAIYIGTIHSYIYKPVTDKDGNLVDFRFSSDLCENDSPDLIVVDEASMVQENIFSDLMQLEVPVIFVGDHGQLPPVKSNSFNLMENPQIKLETIHRNAGGIAEIADKIRRGDKLNYGQLKGNVWHLNNQQANDPKVMDIIYHPSQDNMIICATNLYRTSLNRVVLKYIRGIIKNQTIPEIPIEGDRVICLRNNKKLGIFNGMQGEVDYIKDQDSNHYKIGFIPDGGKLIHVKDVSKYFFLNESGKEPKGMNPRHIGERFDYCYAITCHKSQGSEADNVVVLGDGFGDQEFRRRWQYTAFTRAIKNLYIVN